MTSRDVVEELCVALGDSRYPDGILAMEKLIHLLEAYTSLPNFPASLSAVVVGELQAILQLFTVEKNVLFLLLDHLPQVDFEGRKDVVHLFALLITLGSSIPDPETTTDQKPETGTPTKFQKYLETSSVLGRIIESYASIPELSLNYGLILRELCKHADLSGAVLETGALYRLFGIARHNTNFDLASDAFLSIKDLLTKHKQIAARYILDRFEEFFNHYHELLLADDAVLNPTTSGNDLYVCQRQSLKLLSDMLLDRAFMHIMLKYIDNDEYLKVHMQFLRSSSRTIQFEAFHVFKIFAANPQKKPRVTRILYQNRTKLIQFLDTFLVPERSMDNQFLQDKATVIQKLKVLQLPEEAAPGPQQGAGTAPAASGVDATTQPAAAPGGEITGP